MFSLSYTIVLDNMKENVCGRLYIYLYHWENMSYVINFKI